MLTSDFRTLGQLKLEEVQFITAIALDGLGEYEAAKETLGLFVKEKEDENGVKPSEQLSKEILESGEGMVKGFLRALYTKPLVSERKDYYYNKVGLRKVSDSIKSTDYSRLYNQVMMLIASNNKSDYIVLYMKTQMWMNTFKTRAVSGGAADEVIAELHEHLMQFVINYSSEGKYDMKTRTPNAFLMYTYNSYIRGKKPYYKIINGAKSIMSATSDEDARSLVDRYSDDDRYDVSNSNYSKSEPIDFMGIAKKIYKASYCLFNHGADKGIAYSDIVTWYKQYLSSNLKEQYMTALSGLSKVYRISYADTTDGLCQEAMVKCRIRNKTCAFMYNRMQSGVTIYDIYQLFEEVAGFSARLSNGNSGTPLFTYGGLTAKKGSNQYKFQSIYEGFCALKELVSFLNSPKNNTGVDIFNFPVQIFRDKRLLNRFNSLQDYILLYQDVLDLIYEIDSNPVRQQEYNDTTLFSNEVVYAKMLELSARNSDIDALLLKARDINLSQGANLTLENKADIFKRTIEEPLNDFLNKASKESGITLNYQSYKVLANNFDNKPAQFILLATIQRLIGCYNSIKDPNSTDICLKNIALSIINSIDVMCEFLGEPIDVSGNSTISDMSIEQILERCGVPKGEQNLTIKGKDIKLDCFNFLVTLYEAAIKILSIDKLSLQSPELPFNIARLLNGVVNALDNCRQQIVQEIQASNEKKEDQGNMFLSYAKILNRYPVINIEYPIKDIASLIPYLAKPYVVDINQLETKDYADAMFERQQLSQEILDLLNEHLQYYEQLFLVFKEFNGFAKDTLKVVGNATGVSAAKHRMMTMLSNRINAERSKSRFASDLEKISHTFNCHYDNNRYLMKHRNYVTLDSGKYYVHEDGYKVLPGILDEFWIADVEAEIIELTEQDITNIEIDLRGR